MRVRRMMLESEFGEMGLRYKTGEIEGNGTGSITIEHGLGEVPFLFAFVSSVTGEETDGTVAGMCMNTGLKTRYTSTASKMLMDIGNIIYTDGVNTVANTNPSSASYGVNSVDETHINITRYSANQNFISGKVYKWIAIADWR